jgi:hypothetical protein
MRKKCQGLVLSLLLIAGSAIATEDKLTRAEARQTIEDTTPRAQYNTSQREAQAAYQEALNDCKKMRGAEKTACAKEARTNLQNDLAEAKKLLSDGASSSGK